MIKDPSKFHFRGQMENEVVKDFYRRHWIALLPQFFSFIFLMTFIIILAANVKYFALPSLNVFVFEVLVILAMIGTGVLMHKFFMSILEYFMNVVIITNNRVVIVKKSLFTHDDKQSIYMKEIQDLQKQQSGIVKNIFHYGEILINVGVPELSVLRLVPHPNYHFRLLSMIRHNKYESDDKREHQDLGLLTEENEEDTAKKDVLRAEDVSL